MNRISYTPIIVSYKDNAIVDRSKSSGSFMCLEYRSDCFVPAYSKSSTILFGNRSLEDIERELSEAMLKMYKGEVESIVMGSNPEEGRFTDHHGPI
jgi:ferredoxin